MGPASTDLESLTAALDAYPEQLSGWLAGLTGTLTGLGSLKDSILVVDLPLPLPLTAAASLPLATYLHWPGHSVTDWAQINYNRS